MRRSMKHVGQHSGFTLVEVLVSVAIALLLIVGVNTVFKVTAQTVGAGESLLSANRDARTTLRTLTVDMGNVDAVPPPGSTVGDAPFFIIGSNQVFAFRNAVDQQTATSQTDPSTDTNLFKNYPGNKCPTTVINTRSHRVDRVAFFARGLFARQTTSDNVRFVSTTAGNEAMIVYGHSQQPNKAAFSGTGTWSDPGSGTASTNPYNFYASDWMLSRMAFVLQASPTDGNVISNAGALTPLSTGSSSPSGPIASAMSDLAQTSIASYGSQIAGVSGTWPDSIINYRFQASPFLLTTSVNPKVNPSRLAQIAPCLVRGCSQFIVEYAGNFYTKDSTKNDGSPAAFLNNGANPPQPQTVPTPDPTGILDYSLVNGVRQIRWYGMPRSLTGSATVPSATSGDVVPLSVVYGSLSPPFGSQFADAERTGALPYEAAWGPDVKYQAFPKMIRIVIEVDDHEGRLNQPQRYEFVYDVQQ